VTRTEVRLEWAEGAQTFPALAPPDDLQASLSACQTIRKLIDRGELIRTSEGITAWVNAAPDRLAKRERRSLVSRVAAFLGPGGRLEDAETVFERAYTDYLTHDPRARAAFWLAHVILSEVPAASWVAPEAVLAVLPACGPVS
jgi:hypothetical protein